MKLGTLVVAVIAGLCTSGCAAMYGTTATYGPPILIMECASTHDLVVQAWDPHHNAPFRGARVTVVETGDRDFTNSLGRTRRLATPDFNWVTVVIEWPVRNCYGCPSDYHWRSYQRRVDLWHTVREVRFDVDIRPPY